VLVLGVSIRNYRLNYFFFNFENYVHFTRLSLNVFLLQILIVSLNFRKEFVLGNTNYNQIVRYYYSPNKEIGKTQNGFQ